MKRVIWNFTVYRPLTEIVKADDNDTYIHYVNCRRACMFEEDQTEKVNNLKLATDKCIEEGILVPITVRAKNLSEVFKFTNSIDFPWHERDEVIVPASRDLFMYSSSVGDIVHEPISNRSFMIAEIGFIEIV